jgi:uncharacterized membrane protein YhaH (DUF805 family)
MAIATESRIYRLSGICALLVAISLIVPRLVSGPSDGAATAAVMTFLIVLAIALLISLYLLMITLRRFRDIPMLARLAGIGPSIALVLLLTGIISLLRF